VVNFNYSNGDSISEPIDVKACNDEELLYFWTILGDKASRFEYRDRTGIDPGIKINSSNDDIDEFCSWLDAWKDSNPEKYKEVYGDNE
jgi:hypothetical protein